VLAFHRMRDQAGRREGFPVSSRATALGESWRRPLSAEWALLRANSPLFRQVPTRPGSVEAREREALTRPVRLPPFGVLAWRIVASRTDPPLRGDGAASSGFSVCARGTRDSSGGCRTLPSRTNGPAGCASGHRRPSWHSELPHTLRRLQLPCSWASRTISSRSNIPSPRSLWRGFGVAPV
jgi:hypothetical protein